MKKNYWITLATSCLVLGMMIGLNACKKDKKGCSDHLANNYDANATVDDATCTYDKVLGCTNPNADNYNAAAQIDDGTCVISGCTDPTMDNYNPDATIDNGTCIDKRQKWAGSWSVTDDCDDTFFPIDANQTITFSTTSLDTIWFAPANVPGVVNDTVVTIPVQTYLLLGGWTGNGTINVSGDTTITMNFTYSDSLFIDGSCTATYTKD